MEVRFGTRRSVTSFSHYLDLRSHRSFVHHHHHAGTQLHGVAVVVDSMESHVLVLVVDVPSILCSIWNRRNIMVDRQEPSLWMAVQSSCHSVSTCCTYVASGRFLYVRAGEKIVRRRENLCSFVFVVRLVDLSLYFSLTSHDSLNHFS